MQKNARTITVYSRPKSRVYRIPKRNRNYRRRASAGLFSILKPANLLKIAPHMLSMVGTPGLGYPAVQAILEEHNYPKAIQFAAANEILLFTGYDVLAHVFNPVALFVNYGSILMPRLFKRLGR